MKLSNTEFIKNLNQNYIFENNPFIAVGVSGGPDSMALVFLLNQWIKKKGGSLIALIFDHKIRKENYRESRTIKNYLSKYKIKSCIIRAPKSKVIKLSMNEARVNRFYGLINYCKTKKILHLFLAHHYDDNIETFLTRKVSGSNLEGLACMSNISYRNNIQILRPFLDFSKKNILNYNKKNNIFYLDDPNNCNLKYTRVAIRKFIQISDNLKYIKSDFNNLSNDIALYKRMIWETLHNILLKVKTDLIEIKYNEFIKIDNLIIEKHILLIHKYFFQNKMILRSAKIQNFLNDLKQNQFKKYNLGGLIIEKSDCLLMFYGKKS